MNTQVIFKIDKNLKNQAMRKAQNEGISFTTILKLATKAFVGNELNVGLVVKEVFNPRARKSIVRELKDIKSGKNISPGFNNAKDAIAYLKSWKI